MNFPVSVPKVIQAIGVLFREDHAHSMAYMRLLKLLYIADRESLAETGRPITGGPVAAMDRGPVLETVYDLIRGRHREMALWAEFLEKAHYRLRLLKQPDVGKLSRYEVTKLQEIAKRHEEDDEWALSEFTHTFAEYQKNKPANNSSRAIPLADVLEAVGKGGAAAEVEKEAHDVAVFNRLFGG